ncbi:hypothetical protein RRG08_006248 [Elysia crispata]|uniref:Uncharacterized protein n=1 Tax=Elysia crispata TaxID=231223 RepID=A0AAE0YQ58_9GAST|nr:hypothetical protein RRG08_006248 [Elysia crispata]
MTSNNHLPSWQSKVWIDDVQQSSLNMATWQSKAWIDDVQQSPPLVAEQSMDRWRPTIISPRGRAKSG